MMKYKVMKAYNDAPEQPIKIEDGEILKVVDESDINGDWPNWVFCKGIDKQGWVPKQILNIQENEATSIQDYHAIEHNLTVGETLIAEYSLNGWIWGVKASNPNKFAWAPLNHLQAELIFEQENTMNIRKMTIADYDQVIKLWSATEAMLLRDADSRESIERYLGFNSGLSFVAEKSERIVGAILVGSDGRRGYVQHLAVHQSERGAGIGKQLITSAISALESIGISKTHLFVANNNINAQQFYESLGWFPRDEVRMYSFNASGNQNI